MRDVVRRRVVVGVDGSLASLAALRHGVELARWQQSDLRVVHVRRMIRPELVVAGATQSPSWRLLTQTRAADHEALALIESCLARSLGVVPSDVRIDRLVIAGDAARMLCAQVGGDGDRLVLGTRGGRRWHHPGRPSVSRYCLAHAVCPVLAVPRESSAQAVCCRFSGDRPRMPHDLWREFDSTDA